MPGRISSTQDGAIATVTLDNPDKLNAIDLGMWQQLAATMTQLAADPALRCIIICGSGDQAFAAGGDIEEFRTARADLDAALRYHAAVGEALNAVADCPLPVLAVISGACIGGGLEIAAACDLRLASAKARFGAPINRLGFSMYPQEMAMLLRLASPAVLAEILLEGRILSAEEALRKGLVNRVVAADALNAEAQASAERIAAGAPLVAQAHKKWLRRLQQDAPLSDAELRESFAFLDSADYREGIAAFLAKRQPVFRGC